MAGYFALTGQIIKDGGGKFIKSLGDGGLAVSANLVDEGILSLRNVQRAGEGWLAQRGYKSRVMVKVDIGPVVLGMAGSPATKYWMFSARPSARRCVLPSNGFSMTSAAFRRLAPKTRKFFKKHTPPIRHIGTEDHRPRGRAPDE